MSAAEREFADIAVRIAQAVIDLFGAWNSSNNPLPSYADNYHGIAR